MSELKTLKDMLAEPQLSYISKEALRQEALKWVKTNIVGFSKAENILGNFKMIQFFNITEEDLK